MLRRPTSAPADLPRHGLAYEERVTKAELRSLDALLPAEMAVKAEDIGVAKAGMNPVTTLALADPGLRTRVVLVGDRRCTVRLRVGDVASFLLHNLLPVTIGNMIGGAGLVGATYWFVYLRRRAS